MATRTSVGSGLWSAAGTWDTGVPADDDVVVIAAGHTVEFNVDQSLFSNGIDGITIAGTLKLTRTAGTYYLKIKAAKYIRGTGTFDCGASVDDAIPFTAKHTIAGGVGWYIDGGYSTGLTMTVFAAEPTIKYVLTTGIEAIGQTILEVDTSVLGDLWQIGDTVRISNVEKANNSEERVISNISATEITISVGLTSAKSQYSSIALVSRNVKFISNGGNYIYNFIKTGKTLTIGGGEFRGNNSYNCIATCNDIVISGGVFSPNTSNSTNAFYNCIRITVNGGVIAGVSYGFYACTTMVINNLIVFGINYLATGGVGLIVNNITFRGGIYISGSCIGISINGGNYYGLYQLLGSTVGTCIIRGTVICTYFNMLVQSGHFEIDGTNITCSSVGWLAYWGATIKAKNLSMTGIANQIGSYDMLNDNFYSESIDHNKSIGNYKCWTKGGYGETDTSIYPVGFTDSIKITLNTTIDAKAFYRNIILVPAGKSVVVTSYLRKHIAMTYLPRIWVFENGYEPFYDPTKIIHEFIMTDSIDVWESESYVYTNSTAYDKMLEIRAVGKNTTSYFNVVIGNNFGGGLSRSRVLGGAG